jgi:hypothetical protein
VIHLHLYRCGDCQRTWLSSFLSNVCVWCGADAGHIVQPNDDEQRLEAA